MRGLKNNLSLQSLSVKISLKIPTSNYMTDVFTTWSVAIIVIFSLLCVAHGETPFKDTCLSDKTCANCFEACR